MDQELNKLNFNSKIFDEDDVNTQHKEKNVSLIFQYVMPGELSSN